MTSTSLRPARREDCRTIARLFQISSDGVADYLWSRFDCPGLSLLEIGAQRYIRDNAAFSWRNCQLAVRDGRTVGMLHSFAVPERGTERHGHPGAGRDRDAVLQPYRELVLPGSLYVCALAVFPEHRGQGIGGRLLAAAHQRARSEGHPSVSAILFEGNRGAMRLCEREGYRTVARREIVPHPMIAHRGDAVLMVRGTLELDGTGRDRDDTTVVPLRPAAA